jgi:hypothetical protein
VGHFVVVAFRDVVAVEYQQRSENLDAGFDNSARCPLPLGLIFAILTQVAGYQPHGLDNGSVVTHRLRLAERGLGRFPQLI